MGAAAKARRAWMLAPAVAVAMVACALTPDIALADTWLDGISGFINDINPVNAIVNIIASIIRDFDSMLFSLQSAFAKELMKGTVYSDFTNLFGGQGQAIYNFAVNVNRSIVKTVGYTLLSICFLIQLAKLATRVSSNDTMPMVKDVMILMVYLAVMKFLVDNSVEICRLMFAVAEYLIQVVSSASAQGVTPYDYSVDPSITSIPTLLVLLLVALLGFVVLIAAWLVSYVVVWARALQIYLFMAFSPIPISLLGAEETRQYGMGFLKNFLAACISLAILLFIFLCFPLIHSVVATGFGQTPAFVINDATPIPTIVRSLAIWILMLYALVKSGSWARDLLSG